MWDCEEWLQFKTCHWLESDLVMTWAWLNFKTVNPWEFSKEQNISDTSIYLCINIKYILLGTIISNWWKENSFTIIQLILQSWNKDQLHTIVRKIHTKGTRSSFWKKFHCKRGRFASFFKIDITSPLCMADWRSLDPMSVDFSFFCVF